MDDVEITVGNLVVAADHVELTIGNVVINHG